MDAEQVSGPADQDVLGFLPITEIKSQLRLSTPDEDDVLQEAILDAYAYFDGRSGWLRRVLLPQQWRWYRDDLGPSLRWGQRRADCIPLDQRSADVAPVTIEVPLAPLASIDEIAVTDGAGGWTVVDPTTYSIVTGTLFGQVTLAAGAVWPTVTPGPRAVRITFTAGYPTTPAVPAVGQTAAVPAVYTIPRPIKRAIKLLVGSLYANREATLEDSRITVVSKKIEYGIEALAGRLRIPNDLIERH